MIQKILLATDGSDASRSAVHEIGQFVTGFPYVQLIGVYVTPQNVYFSDTLLPYNAVEIENDYARGIEEELQEECLEVWGKHVRFIHSVGNPAAIICQVAQEEDVDLIVMGNHGRGSIDHLLLGSVSHAVVHKTTKPVFIVKGK